MALFAFCFWRCPLPTGKPFDDEHIGGLVASTAALGERRLFRVLSETAGHGDDLSARVRSEILTHLAGRGAGGS